MSLFRPSSTLFLTFPLFPSPPPPPPPTAAVLFPPNSKSSSSKSHARRRFICHASSSQSTHLKFVLHDTLDSSGFDTTNSREARKGLLKQMENLTEIERETSISINRCVDLGKTALYIAAEDNSLFSNSSLPFPVDHFIERLDDLSMDFCSSFSSSSSFTSSPHSFLDCLHTFLYVNKGFKRVNLRDQLEPKALYLHSVLTYRMGSAAMLSLVYSEILKMLRLWGLLDFDCEIFFPHDPYGLPRGYHKQKSKESDHLHILTSQNLLVEMLRNLKEAFWPFQHDSAKSLFLRAADAANYIQRSLIVEDSGIPISFTKGARHRQDHDVYTSACLGDMRLALSACERLILLGSDPKESRDYSILLYHCGFYEQSLEHLMLYRDKKSFSFQTKTPGEFNSLEEDAVEKLMVRLNLISMEAGWSKPSHAY